MGLREEALEAAKRILPDTAQFVPRQIPELTYLEQAARYCFLNDLKGEDAEIIKRALKQLDQTGVLI